MFIKPNQHVHNLKVGTEYRFGQELGHPSRPIPLDVPSKPMPLDLPTTGFSHPATRPFSKYQTPTPKNEELYRIFPVKEVNALPAFLPTPVTLVQQSLSVRPKATYFKDASGGSSEYDARGQEEQDENESNEQYDILRSSTKPMVTTTTTTTTMPRTTRRRKPTTTTTTTSTAAPYEYDEYSVANGQQLQLQEQLPHEYQSQHEYHRQQEYETVEVTTTEATGYAVREERPVVVPLPVNKYKKKKPLPVSRPKEPVQPQVEEYDSPERVALIPNAPTTVAATTTTTSTTTTTTTTTAPSQSNAETAASDARAKTKAKYGNGTRPRFSIKDYKTTTSTTVASTEKVPFAGRRTTTTTAASAVDPETVDQQTTVTVRKQYKPRARPNRYKASTTTAPTTEEPQQQETTTATTAAYRSKYKPGKYYNRLRTTTESTAVAVADEVDGNEPVAATEPTKPAVYSAKRRTVPTTRMTATAAVEEYNALRRSSSVSPPSDLASESMDAASSEDVDYVATTVAITPSAPRHKFHSTYATERPLLPIESFFQSSMAAKRHHGQRR